MNELALFAGAGGGILGGKLCGWRTVCAVEINEYARRVLLARQDVGQTKPVKDGWRKDDHLNGTRTHSPVMLEVKNRWKMDAETRNGKAPNEKVSDAPH